jgi:Helix-turn-helix domain/GAF domain
MQESFGARMRQWREQLDIPLATVAEQTKIKAALLEALERDDLARWPTGIFRRSFVRSYASAIGLDPDICVRDFLACHPEPVEPAARDLASPEEIEAPPGFLRQTLGAALGSLFHRRRAHDQRHDPDRRPYASDEPAPPEYVPVKVHGNPAAGRKKTAIESDAPETQAAAAAVPASTASVEGASGRPIRIDVPTFHLEANRSKEQGLDTPAPGSSSPANATPGRVLSLGAAPPGTLSPVLQPEASAANAVNSRTSAPDLSVSSDAAPKSTAAVAAGTDAAADRMPSERTAPDSAMSEGVISGAVRADHAGSTSTVSDDHVPTSATPDDAAQDGLRLRIDHETVVPAAGTTPPGPDLLAAAQLCTALGQVSELGDTAALLEDVVRILDAKGVIVWVFDPDSGELTPILAHGYSYRQLAQLPNVGREDDNATAAAFRSIETSTVSGSASASGALVVPLIAPCGCAGVLALELRNELVQSDTIRAVATIFAAQLARVIDLAYPALMADRKLA